MNFSYRLSNELELRLFEPRHTEEIYEVVVRNRGHLRKWLPWVDGVSDIDDVAAMPLRNLADLADHGHFYMGIWRCGQLVGTLGIHEIDLCNCSTSLGYWLDEQAQGQGIMTQACRVLLDYLFVVKNLNRIEIRAVATNKRSRAVAERLGFQCEAIRRQAYMQQDQVIYGLLRDEWHDTGERLAFSHPLFDDTELRLLLPDYAEEIYSLVDNNREHLRWMTFTEGTRSVEDIRIFIRHTLKEMAEAKGLSVAVVYQNRLAGIFGGDSAIGYWLAEEFQGKGLMTHAGRAILSHLFNTLRLNRIEVCCDVRNARSRALAERLGFVYEGTKRQGAKIGGEFVDMHYFGLLRPVHQVNG